MLPEPPGCSSAHSGSALPDPGQGVGGGWGGQTMPGCSQTPFSFLQGSPPPFVELPLAHLCLRKAGFYKAGSLELEDGTAT